MYLLDFILIDRSFGHGMCASAVDFSQMNHIVFSVTIATDLFEIKPTLKNELNICLR